MKHFCVTLRVDASSSNPDKLDEIQRKLREIESDELSVGKDDIEMTDIKQMEEKTTPNDVHITVPVSVVNGVDEETDVRTSLIQGLGNECLVMRTCRFCSGLDLDLSNIPLLNSSLFILQVTQY